jgi:adenylate cyclase
MAAEIERKFLVLDDGWRKGATGETIRQGYIAREGGNSVRVRIAGTRATLTIKRERAGPERDEFEYAIPLEDAHALLEELCGGRRIEKTRYRLRHAGLTWEVDEFAGANAGLVLAEVELERADQPVELPPFAGREVTDDARFRNASLIDRPFDPSWLDEA